MIDHTGVSVRDYEKSKAFYAKALEPIRYELLMEIPNANVAGFGEAPKPDFWIHQSVPNSPRLHVAFRTDSRRTVDAFHRAALAAGGRDNGAPGLRPQYHPSYYGAFVLDPDGHNIEVVCHTPDSADT